MSEVKTLYKKEREHSLVCTCEHVIHDGHKLHDPLIKMEVLQSLEQVCVLPSIGSDHGNLLWLGLCRQH